MALVVVSCFFACLTDVELVHLPEDEVTLSTDSDKASCSAGDGLMKPVAGLECIGPSTAHKGNPHVASVICLVPVGDLNPPAASGVVHMSRQQVQTWVQLQGTFHKQPSASWRFCSGELHWETADTGKCEYLPSPKGGFGSVTTGMQDQERGKLGRGGCKPLLILVYYHENWSSTRETSRVDYFKTTFILADWIFIPKLTHKLERLKTILTPIPAVLQVKYGRMHLARPFNMPHLTEVTQIGQDLTNSNWVIFQFTGHDKQHTRIAYSQWTKGDCGEIGWVAGKQQQEV
ncbi:hypothetical protein H4582DRAFT_2060810 [Lactarius indigo]|nr:hypothetical protein H4582DRAFT_2060810 [Lactarius indigo]